MLNPCKVLKFWNTGQLARLVAAVFFIFLAFSAFSVLKVYAACPAGSDLVVPSGTTITIDNAGPCNYHNVVINGTLTTPVGKKLELVASGIVTINSTGIIDVSGKGDNSSGKGADGTSNGRACVGVYGSGGGGGGYGGAGGKGCDDVSEIGGSGGSTYGSNTSPFDLGSPGGIGGGNSSGNGMGGGAVKITAKEIRLYGTIKANGTDGSDPATGDTDGTGVGGGGSGGSVWLLASDSFDFTGGSIEAKGGSSGSDANCGGHDGIGGGGGGGRISLWYKGPKIGTGTYSVAGGSGCNDGASGSFYENPCYGKTCDNYCDGNTAYYNGYCDPSTGNCVYNNQVCSCICQEGSCIDSKGGLVPCGRLCDDPSTPYINEKNPCSLCTLILMVQRIIDFLVKLAAVVALFAIVLGGLLYMFSSGNQSRMEAAKTGIKYALLGFIVIFIAWAVVATILAMLGYIDPLNGEWYVVNC